MLSRIRKLVLPVPVQPTSSQIQGSHNDVAVIEHLVEEVSDRSDGMQGKNGQGTDGDPALQVRSSELDR